MSEVFAVREEEPEEEFEEGVFADFTLEKEIGKGGQGTIYQAVKKGEDTRVALKISNKLTEKSDIEFAKETAALAELNGDHPGVVKILETGTHEKRPFIALELVEGQNLEDILNQYKKIRFGSHEQFMPADYMVNVLIQIAEALDFAHKKNVVHGDLKPANVLITKDDKVKITDFGLSKLVSQDLKHSLSVTGEVAGSIQYMSPELQNGEELGIPDDIYSLGIMIYHTLTNRLPLDDRFTLNPSDINTKLNEKIDEIYQKCIAKKEKRYQNITELLNDLIVIHKQLQKGRLECLREKIQFLSEFENAIDELKEYCLGKNGLHQKIEEVMLKLREFENINIKHSFEKYHLNISIDSDRVKVIFNKPVIYSVCDADGSYNYSVDQPLIKIILAKPGFRERSKWGLLQERAKEIISRKNRNKENNPAPESDENYKIEYNYSSYLRVYNNPRGRDPFGKYNIKGNPGLFFNNIIKRRPTNSADTKRILQNLEKIPAAIRDYFDSLTKK